MAADLPVATREFGEILYRRRNRAAVTVQATRGPAASQDPAKIHGADIELADEFQPQPAVRIWRLDFDARIAPSGGSRTRMICLSGNARQLWATAVHIHT